MGGEAKRNEFLVRGQRLIGPQGSNATAVPHDGSFVEAMWKAFAGVAAPDTPDRAAIVDNPLQLRGRGLLG